MDDGGFESVSRAAIHGWWVGPLPEERSIPDPNKGPVRGSSPPPSPSSACTATLDRLLPPLLVGFHLPDFICAADSDVKFRFQMCYCLFDLNKLFAEYFFQLLQINLIFFCPAFI